jgi:hypothetical protein
VTTDIHDHRPRRNPIAWAVFLATSWTWCIGMFLPVLLIHDFGFAGWLVFAIPNVIGAAAMGWIIRSQEQSRQMVRDHRAASVAFSLVTILFHLFFVAWVLVQLTNPLIALLAVLLAVATWMLVRTDRRSVRAAIVVYVFSLLAFFIIIALTGSSAVGESLPLSFGQHSVAWLFPVCCLGFLTCPYLDLTFHRARQSTSHDGAKVAFGLGFGLFFLLMILFTLWYAEWIYQRVFHDAQRDLIIWLVAGHMIVQSAFTIAAHARVLCPAESIPRSKVMSLGGIAFIITALLAGALMLWPAFGPIGYLLFMSFYALVAPAYVCCSIVIHRRAGLFFLFPVILAAPMYWLGFFLNWTIWLLPAVAIVLIAAVFARYSGSSAASANSESRPARQESML